MAKKKVSFSGGRTSAYMLWLLLQEFPQFRQEFMVLFCNTGKEFNATLDFVRDCEQAFGVEVVWLEYTRVPATAAIRDTYRHPKSIATVQKQIDMGETTHWFKQVNYNTARRNGSPHTPFDELLDWANVLPNQNNRMCSVQMKLRTMMRYLFSIGVYEWEDYIGIRADEAHRVKEIERNTQSYAPARFPLVEMGVTVRQVKAFWKKQPFDLQLKDYEGNCDLCYLKKWWKRVKVARENPGTCGWWEGWENRFALKADGDGRYFQIGKPYAAVENDATHAEFDFMSRLEEIDGDIPCGCTTGAFTQEDIDECAA